MEENLWYYRGLVEAFRHSGATGFLMDELDRTVQQLEERTGLEAAT